MTRVIFAGLVGGAVYFVWQMSTWMFLPIHAPTVNALPDDSAARELFMRQNLETGVYVVPYGTDEDMADLESEFTKNHQNGPIFTLFYTKNGSDPMPISMLIIGFVNDFLAAFIVAWLLSCACGCCSTYGKRVGFVTAFGVFLALTAHVSYFNWMRFPVDWTLMFIVDAVGGWLLAGLLIAAIIRKPLEKAADDQD